MQLLDPPESFSCSERLCNDVCSKSDILISYKFSSRDFVLNETLHLMTIIS